MAVTVARIFSLLCGLVQLPILTRLLEPSEFAFIAVAIAVSTYFSLVAAEPVILPFQRFPGSSLDRGNYRFASRRTLLYLSCVAAVAIVVGGMFGGLFWALAIVGWGGGVAISRLVSTAWLAWGLPWRYSLNLMLSTGVRTAALVGMVFMGFDALLSLAIAGLAGAFGAIALSPRWKCAQRSAEKPWSSIFGVRLAIASTAVTVLTNSSLIVLPFFAEANEVGRFAAMAQIGTFASGAVLGLLLAVAYPRLRQEWDDRGEKRVLQRLEALRGLCLAVGFFSVSLLTVGDYWLAGLFVGPAFVDGRLLPVLVVSTVFASMGNLASWEHQFRLEARMIAQRTTVCAIVGLVAAVGLAAVFGTIGAAFGAAAGFAVYYLVMSSGTAVRPGLHVATAAFFSIALLVLLGELPSYVAAGLTLVGAALVGPPAIGRLIDKKA